MKLYLPVLLFSFSLQAQNLFGINPKYNSSNLKLLNKWFFRSMETITHGDNVESEIMNYNDENQEIITFKKSGEIIYFSNYDGVETTGSGRWLIKEDSLSILSNGDTINASYKINDNILSIITVDKETDEFYGFKTIMNYTSKID